MVMDKGDGKMDRVIQVLTTIDSEEGAERIARAVVERRVAACAQILGPITSVYRWEGNVETAKEWLCLIKSIEDCYSELEAAIRENHPYEVPEILAISVIAGNRSYIDWVREETKVLGQDH
jgi:periplasmic divalent cation tolerance protein